MKATKAFLQTLKFISLQYDVMTTNGANSELLFQSLEE